MFADNSFSYSKNLVADAVRRAIPLYGEVVILAIGSDRVTGDCVGPIVGHLLSDRGFTVYGDLRSPVNALNIGEAAEIIKKRHPTAFVLAVDSAVGSDGDIGKVRVFPRGVRPAAAIGRPLPRVGNASVVGIVAAKRLGVKALGEVRLGSVFFLANVIADGIELALLRRKAALEINA